MLRRLPLVLAALVLCVLSAAPVAGIDRDQSSQGELSGGIVYDDSSAVFRIDQVANAFPMEPVSVPIYLETDSFVQVIDFTIKWNPDELTLTGIRLGEACIDDSLDATLASDSLVASISNVQSTIPGDTAIAYLDFIPQCYGFGERSEISFAGDRTENTYTASSGRRYAPTRLTSGSVTTYSEYLCLLQGTNVEAFPCDQGLSMPVLFYQQIDGKPYSVTAQFDNSIIRIDSITPGDSIHGTLEYTVDGGTITINFSEDNPLMPPCTNEVIFDIHFGLTTNTGGISTPMNFTSFKRLDYCGEIKDGMLIDATINVPLHTADTEIKDVTYYTTSEEYEVPFRLDSSYPVNDLKFSLEYSLDTLNYVGYSVSDVFYGITVAVNEDQNTGIGILTITNFQEVNFDSLPADILELVFEPAIPLPDGTEIGLKFKVDGENYVKYFLDDPELCGYEYSEASPTKHNGTISIVSPPRPPACPTLYVWDGEKYVKDNTILAECDGQRVEKDVTDYYLLTKTAVPVEGGLRFQIREDGKEISYFKGFKVIAVDHPEHEPIKTTDDGRIIKLGRRYRISWAKDYKGEDITALIKNKDRMCYESTESGWFEVSFGKLSKTQLDGPIALTSGSPPKEPIKNLTSSDTEKSDKKVRVFIKDKDGSWKLISKENARLVPTDQSIVLEPGLLKPGQELVLRYSWDNYYMVDKVSLNSSEDFGGKVFTLEPVAASHSSGGNRSSVLATLNESESVKLTPGERIDLTFDTGSLPPLKRGIRRDYIFVSIGKYFSTRDEGAPRRSFVLDANFPNPFNPSTTIRYNLPQATYVELRIFDVRGSLVRTLVCSEQQAGEKSVTWDGLTDSGLQAASGVYFYRLKTPEFTKTRKMILLR